MLDQNAPRGLRTALTGHDIRTSYQMGWGELTNGHLMTVAEAGFGLMITGDKNIRFQQRMEGRTIAVLVLSEPYWPTVRTQIEAIMAAIEASAPGKVSFVGLPRRKLNRRPPLRFEP